MASLLALFNSFKKTGKSATLILSTKGGDVTAKLEVKLINAKSSPSSTTTPSPTLLTPPGCQDSRDRQRPHRSAARRTKANARAAQHRLHQALPFSGGEYTAAVGPAPPRRPLHHHLSLPIAFYIFSRVSQYSKCLKIVSYMQSCMFKIHHNADFLKSIRGGFFQNVQKWLFLNFLKKFLIF